MEERLGRGSKALLLLAAAVIVLVGMDLAASVIVPLLLAAFVAVATSPVVDWLRRKGIPTGVAVLAVIVGVLGALGALGFVITTAFMDLNDALPGYLSEIGEAKRAVAGWATEHGMHHAARSLAALDLNEWLTELLTETVLSGAPDLVSSFVIVVLVAAFILLEAATFRSKASLAARTGGARLHHLGGTVREVQKYLAVKTGISAATGVLVALFTAALGVEHAVLWGLVAFSLNFVPNVGSILAAIPPVVVAWATEGMGTAVAVTLGYIVINMTLGNVLEPKLMGRALGLSPLVVVVSMIVWGYVLGPVGAVLSAPLTMILRIVLSNTEDMKWVAVLLAPPHADSRVPEPAAPEPLPPHPGAQPNEAE